MKSSRPDVQFLIPDIKRDAPYALDWFTGSAGVVTLLSMGNTPADISPPTLAGEEATIREFIELEAANKQITRMIASDGTTIGAVWIELIENHGVQPPSVHIMIGDPGYRGKGIGYAALQAAIDYAFDVLGHGTVYSRHLVSNTTVAKLNRSLGFVADGAPYTDDNDLTWQNIRLEAMKRVRAE